MDYLVLLIRTRIFYIGLEVYDALWIKGILQLVHATLVPAFIKCLGIKDEKSPYVEKEAWIEVVQTVLIQQNAKSQ